MHSTKGAIVPAMPMRRAPAAVTAVVAGSLIAGCLTPPASPTPVPTSASTSVAPSTSAPMPASASPSGQAVEPTRRPSLTSAALREAVTVEAVVEHLRALQSVSDLHGGTRASGTPGFEQSVAYVADALAAAGYVVEETSVDADGVPSTNVVAERAGTETDGEVVMLGAHLDSAAVGPGINDNGSGVAVVLATAEALGTLPAPSRTVRFAFWGAEEGASFGSAAYVAALTQTERERIAAYLNFDMVGSPNPLRLVYAEASAAAGSDALTDVFAAYFASVDLAWEPIDLGGDSDHGPFADAGIPTGGLFSGGIEPVTPQQAATFGAIAGQPADSCSHAACDTLENTSGASLDEMADAVAHGVATLGGAE